MALDRKGLLSRCPAVPAPGCGTAGHLGAILTARGERACPTAPAKHTDAGQQRTDVVPPVPPAVPGSGQAGHTGAAVSTLETLMLGRGGVVLEDSADASRCYPDLWPSPAAARQAFHRARRAAGPVRDDPRWACHAPLRCATYQRAGAGRRPAGLTYDLSAVPLAELRGWLEERVGPLVRLEAEEEGPQPAPPVTLAAPGGAARPHCDSYHSRDRPAAPAPSTAAHSAALMRLLAQRLELAALAEHLWEVRPRRVWGVRELDWREWQAAARSAAGLPSAEWAAWRDTIRTVATDWPPRPPAPPPAGDGTPSNLHHL